MSFKSKSKLLSLLLLGFAFTACEHDDPYEPCVSAEVTIFVHQPTTQPTSAGGRDLTPQLNHDLAEIDEAIVNAQGMFNARILFFRNDLTKGTLYQKVYCKAGGKGIVRNDVVKEYDLQQVDYTTVSGLRQILSDVIAAGQTERFGMVVGCHANGWIPNDEPRQSVAQKGNAPEKIFGHGADDKYNTSYETLAKAITAAGVKMDFILADNCNSQNIEVAYDLRNACDYYIASLAETGADGQPYEKTLPKLVAGDYLSICDDFYNYYTSPGSDWRSATLSTIDCSVMDSMAEVMRRIYQCAADESGYVDTSKLQMYDRYGVYCDLSDYVHQVCHEPKLLAEFDALLSRLVVKNVFTDTYMSAFFNGSRPINTCCGVACSGVNSRYYYQWMDTAWYKATH